MKLLPNVFRSGLPSFALVYGATALIWPHLCANSVYSILNDRSALCAFCHMKSGSRLHTFDHVDVQNWFFAVGSRLGPVPGQLFSLNSGHGVLAGRHF